MGAHQPVLYFKFNYINSKSFKMAHKQKTKKIDWLANWDNTFDWSGETEKQINASKHQIEKFVSDYLSAIDSGPKHDRARIQWPYNKI